MHLSKSVSYTSVLVILLALLFLAQVVASWTGPTASPPNNNVAAPINVGTTDQVKDAGLGLDSLAVFGNAILSGSSRFLNFGNTVGESGYGFRDNAGAMEYKDSGGAWASFGSGAGGDGGDTIQYQTGTWCGLRQVFCSSSTHIDYVSPNIPCNSSSITVSCSYTSSESGSSEGYITFVSCPAGFTGITTAAGAPGYSGSLGHLASNHAHSFVTCIKSDLLPPGEQ